MKKISDSDFVLIYIFVVAFATLLISSNIENKNVENIETNTTVPSNTTTIPEQSLLKLIFPLSCSSSSNLGEGWTCERLYDGETTTWEDNSLACKDGWIEFTFHREIQLEFIVLENPEDTQYFYRNHKIRDIAITTSDSGFLLLNELKNINISQWLDINATTSYLRIDILSAYPGEEINGKVPFDECALQEITFYGREI